MDCKLQELSNNLTLVVNRMDTICDLATQLELSEDLNENLDLAKSSLDDCRILVEIRLIQFTGLNDLESDQQEEKFIETDDTKSFVNSVVSIKNEEESDIKTDVISKKPQDISTLKDDLNHAVVDKEGGLEDYTVAVETKIEIDEYADDEIIVTPTRAPRKSSRKVKKPIKCEINATTKTVLCDTHDNLNHQFITDYADKDSINEPQGDEKCLTLTCGICGSTRQTREDYERHIRSHHRKKKCTICQISVCALELKKHHETEHSGVKVDKKACRQCYRSIPEHEFKKHSETCLPIPIQCAVCGKICNGRKSHSDHVRKHKQSLDFGCDVCGRKYPYEKDLIRHMKASHFDIRTCDICGARLHGEQSFREHMELHDANRERSYSCDECGKSFYRSGQLKHHKKSHSDERPFSCEVCSKSFKYRDNLNKHLRSHNKELFYKCDECGKTFSFKSALIKHLKRIHQIVIKKFSDYVERKLEGPAPIPVVSS